MHIDRFHELVKEIDKHCFNILGDRGSVYTQETDRLSNFKNAGRMLGKTPEEALWGMVVKHIIAVQDAIFEKKDVHLAKWLEWIGDIINYMKLLYALKVEENELFNKSVNIMKRLMKSSIKGNIEK